MAKDLGIDKNFDVFIDDRNDLGLVDGRREVEQSIALQVSLYYYNQIGSSDLPNVEERLELRARRVARENRRIDSLEDIIVEPREEQPNVFEVTIVYNQDEDFSFEVGS